MMLVHRSLIDRLDIPARAIFSSPAVFKREALVGGPMRLHKRWLNQGQIKVKDTELSAYIPHSRFRICATIFVL